MLDNAKLVLARLECRGPLGVGGGGVEKGKKKVEEILLISSCRFPFLYLSIAPLFLPHLLCLCIRFSNFVECEDNFDEQTMKVNTTIATS